MKIYQSLIRAVRNHILAHLPPLPLTYIPSPSTSKKVKPTGEENALVEAAQVARIEADQQNKTRTLELDKWQSQVESLLDELEHGRDRGRRGTLPPLDNYDQPNGFPGSSSESPRLMLHRILAGNLDVFSSLNQQDLDDEAFSALKNGMFPLNIAFLFLFFKLMLYRS